ncbi:serine hydrolase [Candidatus Bathyarchaeota archaeon]|nr:serine hydrolase [Candidatus Bathyarchaeota archaeon]
MDLQDTIIQEIKGLSNLIGVSIKNLNTGEATSINGDEIFPLADLFIIPIAIELYSQVENQILNINEKIILKEEDKVPGQGILKDLAEGTELSLKDLAKLMLIQVDNTATDLLISKIGIDNINDLIKKLGLKKTAISSTSRGILFDLIGLNKIPDSEKTLNLFQEKLKTNLNKSAFDQNIAFKNTTTPNDMNKLMVSLVENRLLRKENSDTILSLLDRCQANEHQVHKYLPTSKIKYIQKTGNLFSTKNSSSIITILASNTRYVITCLSKNQKDNSNIDEIFARVSLATYNFFTSQG